MELSGLERQPEGVYKIEPNQTHLKKIVQTNGHIKDLHLDDFGMLWIGSFEDGLICYDTKKNWS